MLDSLAPRRRRLALSVAGALVVVLMATMTLVVLNARESTTTAPQHDPGPVLLLPGFGANMGALQPLARELRSQGRVVVEVRPPDGGTGDLQAEAGHLADVAHRTLDRTGAQGVDVVGFSAGGVVARLWVRDGDGAQIARRILTLGSPHHGSDVASLAQEAAGACPRACEQLVPDSDLLRKLNAGDESPAGPRWITVRSSSDTTVTPTDSARLDGALDVKVQDLCPAAKTLHGQLPADPVVIALLTTALGAEAPSVPDEVSC